MKLLDQAKQNPGLTGILIAVAALGGMIPNLDRVARYWQSHEIAYAAKQEAEAVKSEFQQYLQEQREFQADLRGYTRALQDQQMQQPTPRSQPLQEWFDEQTGVTYCCDPNEADCERWANWWRCPQ